jgi:lipopolysaccharide export system permease protein
MNVSLSKTMMAYLSRHFFINLLMMLGLLLGLIYLFDTVELLRRAGGKDDVSLTTILLMGLFKLPEAGQILLPFAVLFSAIFTFWQLGRRNELVILRAAGYSAWQFMTPVVGVALLFGLVNIAVINPVGATLLSRFESMESTYLERGQSSFVALMREGLWLRQSIEETPQAPAESVILHAERINTAEWVLFDVMVLFFDQDDEFSRRIDAPRAKLVDGTWRFEDAKSVGRDSMKPSEAALIVLPTNLTGRDIQESFASPQTLSFWALPGFIQTLQQTGFNTTPMKIYFHTLLAQPILFAAMILLAASVSLRPPRAQGTLWMIVLGVTIGFAVFFSSSVLQALGVSEQIPVFLAAWTPALVTTMVGIAVMLNLEDG